MKRKLKIDQAAYDALSDEIKADYIKDGDAWKLDLEDNDVAPELRRALERERTRATDAETRATDLETRLTALEGTDARKRGDIDAIENSWKAKLAAAELAGKTLAEKLKAQISKLLVTDKAREIATEISTAPSVILPHIIARLSADLDGDEPVTRVMGDDGKPSALTLDELKKSFVDNKDFATIIIGSKASGSGGSGGIQGGGATKQPSEYTEAERVELYNKDKTTYFRLFPVKD